MFADLGHFSVRAIQVSCRLEYHAYTFVVRLICSSNFKHVLKISICSSLEHRSVLLFSHFPLYSSRILGNRHTSPRTQEMWPPLSTPQYQVSFRVKVSSSDNLTCFCCACCLVLARRVRINFWYFPSNIQDLFYMQNLCTGQHSL